MRNLIIIPILLLTFCMTSCFDVIEEVTVNDDFSGNYGVTVNMSKSKSQLDKLMLKDSIQGEKIPNKADINKEIDNVTAKLKNNSAFSNVVVKKDFDNYIFSVKFDFTHVNEVEKGIREIMKSFNAGEKLLNGVHLYASGTSPKELKRVVDPSLIDDANKQLNTWARSEIEDANLVSIYRLSSEIKSYSNKLCKLSTSKKSLFLKVKLLDVINGVSSIENEIKF